MTTFDKFKLLANASKYIAERIDDDASNSHGYSIADANADLAAFMSDRNEISYYRINRYCCAGEWLKLDVKALLDLIEFCESLKGE